MAPKGVQDTLFFRLAVVSALRKHQHVINRMQGIIVWRIYKNSGLADLQEFEIGGFKRIRVWRIYKNLGLKDLQEIEFGGCTRIRVWRICLLIHGSMDPWLQ